MQRQNKSWFRLFIAISVSSFIALVLTILPLPPLVFNFWPEWIALIVIFWSLTVPDRVGPWVGFAIGTLLEVLFVRNFGVLGLGMATLAFTVNRASLQLRVLSIWQQVMVIGLFVSGFKLLTGWLYGLIGDFSFTSEYWYSVFGSMLLWPFLFILLQELRRIVRVN